MPAESCSLVRSTPSIILTCRPCHDGFPGRVNRARHKNSKMFYVGLPHNIEFDLSGASAKLVLENAGAEDECVWSVRHGTGSDDIDFRIELLAGRRRLDRQPSMMP